MAKLRTQYVCQNCGASSSKWVGQCPDCGAWNTLSETTVSAAPKSRGGGMSGTAGGRIQRLDQVELAEQPRSPTGMNEMDGVLGGGVVPGAVVLIGGYPGIGKSTLLLQLLT